MREIPNLKSAKPVGNFVLELSFDDGVQGKVDLSEIPRCGFFSVWNNDFEKFSVDRNIISWNENCEMDADAMYLKIIGKNFFEYAGNQ
ncbi:Protein of unknown function [Cruoricaptor ignavus]|uniref:DUF2442 domain-containing protein n=1 Tax=Cruoricaptor ignavus TaxID=1118202 RepID=A0A1M6D9R3_9FLAO|nr:DUF2442 domain-containing protein [Cruoricaptor ignavus]QOR73579.1 DUF2442 domain-containing protein [Cruoricaptor ignavus]SHI69944.1 Protein of unknown function [Cruoricaptor ignavus]